MHPRLAFEDPKPIKDSQATTIVRLVNEAGAELWHSPDRAPHLTLSVNGHAEHYRLGSPSVRDWIARLHHRSIGGVPCSQAVQDALAVLGGDARFDGPEHPTFLRVAHHQDAVYIDLGSEDWGAIEIDSRGWRLVQNPPVRFWA